MKALKLVLGVILTGAGSLMILGAVIVWKEGSSEFSTDVNILAVVLFGVLPIAGGLFLCWHALART